MPNKYQIADNARTERGAPVRCDDGLATFEVKISDKDGLWGCVKLRARNGSAASALAVEYVEEMVRIGDTDADLPTLHTEVHKVGKRPWDFVANEKLRQDAPVNQKS